MTLPVAVTAVFHAYILVLRAYTPTFPNSIPEQVKLLRTLSSTLPPLQTRSRSAAQATTHKDSTSLLLFIVLSSELSSPLSPASLFCLLSLNQPIPNQPSPNSVSSFNCSDSSPIVTTGRKSAMLSLSELASIEQDVPSKVPMLLLRDIMPSVMHMYAS